MRLDYRKLTSESYTYKEMFISEITDTYRFILAVPIIISFAGFNFFYFYLFTALLFEVHSSTM